MIQLLFALILIDVTASTLSESMESAEAHNVPDEPINSSITAHDFRLWLCERLTKLNDL